VNLEMALLVDSSPWAVDVRQVHAYPFDSFLESGQSELKSMFDMLSQAVGEAEAPSSNVYFHGTVLCSGFFDVGYCARALASAKVEFLTVSDR